VLFRSIWCASQAFVRSILEQAMADVIGKVEAQKAQQPPQSSSCWADSDFDFDDDSCSRPWQPARGSYRLLCVGFLPIIEEGIEDEDEGAAASDDEEESVVSVQDAVATSEACSESTDLPEESDEEVCWSVVAPKRARRNSVLDRRRLPRPQETPCLGSATPGLVNDIEGGPPEVLELDSGGAWCASTACATHTDESSHFMAACTEEDLPFLDK